MMPRPRLSAARVGSQWPESGGWSLARRCDGLTAATPRRLVSVRPEEADQLGVHDLRRLFVRVVADTGDQEDFGVGENVHRMPRVLRKVGSVDLSAEDQRLRLDVGPVVHDRIHRTQVATERPYIGQPAASRR